MEPLMRIARNAVETAVDTNSTSPSSPTHNFGNALKEKGKEAINFLSEKMHSKCQQFNFTHFLL